MTFLNLKEQQLRHVKKVGLIGDLFYFQVGP